MTRMRLVVSEEYLPPYYQNAIVKNRNIEEVVVRSNLTCMAEIDDWVARFGELTNTKWNVRSSCPSGQKIMCSKKFICHHSGYKKVPRKENQKGNSKNANCDSGIFVKVKLNTFRTRQSDQFVRKGMLAVITIKTLHTHTLDNAETLRCLPATESMKDTFFGYFNEGMGITESANYHREEMERSGDFQEDDFSNNRMNPSTRVVRHWHDEWKLLHLRS